MTRATAAQCRRRSRRSATRGPSVGRGIHRLRRSAIRSAAPDDAGPAVLPAPPVAVGVGCASVHAVRVAVGRDVAGAAIVTVAPVSVHGGRLGRGGDSVASVEDPIAPSGQRIRVEGVEVVPHLGRCRRPRTCGWRRWCCGRGRTRRPNPPRSHEVAAPPSAPDLLDERTGRVDVGKGRALARLRADRSPAREALAQQGTNGVE